MAVRRSVKSPQPQLRAERSPYRLSATPAARPSNERARLGQTMNRASPIVSRPVSVTQYTLAS